MFQNFAIFINIRKNFEFLDYIVFVVIFGFGNIFVNMPYFRIFLVFLRRYYKQRSQGFYLNKAVIGVGFKIAVKIGIQRVFKKRKFLDHKVVMVKIRRPSSLTGGSYFERFFFVCLLDGDIFVAPINSWVV